MVVGLFGLALHQISSSKPRKKCRKEKSMRHLLGHLLFGLRKGTYARNNSCITTNIIDIGGVSEII